jgi:hypothetical protein
MLSGSNLLPIMKNVDLNWADMTQPLIGGLAGILGVYLIEDMLGRLRRSHRCPERWAKDR